ncbi:unnamed protein product [Closterium sp. Naga37s-1]|nr:unnamed protein product [Closterium sp. Naga37s-1]
MLPAELRYLYAHVVNWMELGKPTDVKTVANVVKQISYNNKNMLSACMIMAGWDQYDGASVYALPQEGTLLKAPFAIGGSGSSYLYAFCLCDGGIGPFAIGGYGSSYLYAFCDALFKEGMSEEEAELSPCASPLPLPFSFRFLLSNAHVEPLWSVLFAAATPHVTRVSVASRPQIDKDGATKKFHPADKLELFWEEMPAQESFLKPLVPASS